MHDRVLAGKRAIVTGGGRGLGRALALALAESGADLALAARSSEGIERVTTEIRERGRCALPVPTDVTETADVERLMERTLRELGGLDILVNNSGAIHVAPLLETNPEDWNRVVLTNLFGTYACMRAAGYHLTRQGSGKIINVASNLAFKGRSHLSAYAASKAAIVSLTRTAAVEWARYGVQVNAVAPGHVETEMNADVRNDTRLYERVVGQVPARRMALPEEIGPLVVYLASSASDFMTGEVLVIDGGEIVG